MCLVAGAALVGVHLAGRVYFGVAAPGGLVGVMPLPDSVLVAYLWAGAAGEVYWSLALGLLAAGGGGWGLARMRGPVGVLTGAMLALAVGTAAFPAGSLVVGQRHAWLGRTLLGMWEGEVLPGGDTGLAAPEQAWLAALSGLGLLAALWAWGRGSRRDAWLLLAAVGGAFAASVFSLAGFMAGMGKIARDLPSPPTLLALTLVGTFPVWVLIALEPGRRRAWRSLVLAGLLPLGIAAATIPRILPVREVVASDHAGQVTLPEWEGWEGDWFATATFLGAGQRALTVFSHPQDDGYASRYVLPDPRLAYGSRSIFPNFIRIKRDVANMAGGRALLRDMLDGERATRIAGLVYLTLVQADPALPAEDLNFIAGLGERFPQWPLLAARAAGTLVLRGDNDRAQDLLDAAVPVLEREARLRTIAGACPEGGCVMPKYLLEATEMTAWPAMRGPRRGEVTIRFGLSRVPGIEEDLYAGLVALHDPDRPATPGGEETVGEWEPAGLAETHPLVDGAVTLDNLPQGRYALQVGFRQGEHEELGLLALSGLPAEPIVVGPGAWEHEILLPVWPEDPLEAWCEDGWLEFPPLPLAAGYRVEGWSIDGSLSIHPRRNWGGGLRLEFADELAGTHVALDSLVPEGQDWPSAGFRVVAIDDFGREMARFYPVGGDAQAYAWDEEACYEPGLAERFTE